MLHQGRAIMKRNLNNLNRPNRMKNYKNCQSCGMPMSKDPEKGGTEKDGSKNFY